MHHPEIGLALNRERIRELQAQAATPRRARTAAPAIDAGPLVIRLCRVDDDPALERLAQLEGRALPGGRFVVAELEGALVAALPLAPGAQPLADPFRRTADIVPLLRLRAEQLRPPRPRSRLLSFGRRQATPSPY